MAVSFPHINCNESDLLNNKSIFFIGGSSETACLMDEFYAAYNIGGLCAKQKIPVVTGGGSGMMEAVNKGAFMSKGVSIGIVSNTERPNLFLSHIIYTTDFLSRIQLVHMSNIFTIVAFPGGWGTLTELSFFLAHIHSYIPYYNIILYGKSFWDKYIAWCEEKLLSLELIKSIAICNFKVCDTTKALYQEILYTRDNNE